MKYHTIFCCRFFLFLPQAIKDLHLLVIVAGLLAVDVVFLSCWIAVDPLQAEILKFEEMVSNVWTILISTSRWSCFVTLLRKGKYNAFYKLCMLAKTVFITLNRYTKVLLNFFFWKFPFQKFLESFGCQKESSTGNVKIIENCYRTLETERDL